jgi:transposase
VFSLKKAFKGFLYETYKKNIHICGSDRNQLAVMAQKARAAISRETLEVFADGGYFSGKEIVACERDGITPNVLKPLISTSKAQDRYGKQDFSYLLGKVSTFAPQVSD